MSEPEFTEELLIKCAKKVCVFLDASPEAEDKVERSWSRDNDPAKEIFKEWVRIVLRESGHNELVAALKEAKALLAKDAIARAQAL